ncbi:MAG: transporter associated domain-containing protein, partial [Methanobacteriaceae archaeon]|nr:transporter associated domain-containing protein [Methanobacteriaceae archaeon]
LVDFLWVIQLKDIFEVEIDSGKSLQNYVKNPIFVPESSDALDILKLFKESKENVHMAIVVDEYGSIEGLITLNDILEAIVGDIPAIDEPEEPKAVQRFDGSWLIDGNMQIEEFKELLNLKTLPEEEKGNYLTLGGFILQYLGRIPVTGDLFQWEDLNFEIIDMDGHHIDKILVFSQKIII